jgi:hypothetical protein
MEEDGQRRIRPALWVIVGALAVPVGLLMALDAAATATRVGGVEGAPRCDFEFAKGCTTQRAAVLDHKGSRRGDWMTREQRWLARVPAGAPGLRGAELLDVTVPRQDGREGLVEGAAVTVVYFGRSPAWIRLPSGVVLETEDHPRRKAPLLAFLALGGIGGGAFAVRTGIRAGRHGGGWLRRTPARVRGGLDVALLLAAMLGAVVHQFAGGTVWPGIVAGLLAAGLGVLLWRRSRRRQAAHA